MGFLNATFNTIGAFVKTVIVKNNALQETWPKGFFTADKTVRNLKTTEIKYFISLSFILIHFSSFIIPISMGFGKII